MGTRRGLDVFVEEKNVPPPGFEVRNGAAALPRLPVFLSFCPNAYIIPHVRPQSLSSTSFPVHYSLIILPLDAVWCELL